MWKFCTFVLHFDNFPGRFEWNDERMQRESFRRRRNDEFVVSPKFIFSIFFVTSYYVLNKIMILSEISTPGWFGTIPGPRAGNFAGEPNFTMKRSQNHPKLRKWENREKHAKTSGFINFSMFKIHFRSADAANHLNARPRGPREIRMIRRAYWS